VSLQQLLKQIARALALSCAGLGVLGLAAPALALDEPAPIVGDLSTTAVEEQETLLDIVYRHRLGYTQVERLNPDLNVWLPEPGTEVLLPTAAILPSAPREGIVINIPEMRLYDYTVGPVPAILALGIGDLDVPTPEGEFVVTRKREDPTWVVPESIRSERPELPAQVPPGDDNPLGPRALTLSHTSYNIHGTNIAWSIGRLVTHGCIRLYNDEIERLYERVPLGTPVRIVYQTVKVGVREDKVFLEVHPDVYHRGTPTADRIAVELIVNGHLGRLDPHSVDRAAIAEAIERARGIPVAVATAPKK